MAQLNHIGIAVSALPELKKLFSLLNLQVTHSEDVLDQGVRTHFIPLSAEGASLEFLEPIDLNSPVSHFIQKRGPGIHHLSFLVEDGTLNQMCERLRSEGYRMIYDHPKVGAHQMRINFIHPSSAGGMLIELMENGSHQ